MQQQPHSSPPPVSPEMLRSYIDSIVPVECISNDLTTSSQAMYASIIMIDYLCKLL